MTHRGERHGLVLEWTRMTSRDQAPYFVPRPTPGYSSAYNTEKLRRKVPTLCMDKSVGREHIASAEEDVRDSSETAQKVSPLRYGATQEEIEAQTQRERNRRFLQEREEYVLAEGKTRRVIGGCNLKKNTGRDSPVFWQSKPTENANDIPSEGPTALLPSKGFTISRAPRFREKAVSDQARTATPGRVREERAPAESSHPLFKVDVGTFGKSPARPEIRRDSREDLSVNYEYVKGHLTRNVCFSRYSSRRPGEEERPSVKYKQLFKQLQRPHAPLSNRLRAGNGMSTMLSVSKGDLPSILKHADNDRLRAQSAMGMNETSTQVREILYPDLPDATR